MTQELQEIEKMLYKVYQKNLDFLRTNFFDIFLDVEQLSQHIESGKYKEVYSLELRDGYFDILNLENNGYYYAKNSYIDAEERTPYVNTSNENSISLLRKNAGTTLLTLPKHLKEVLPIAEFINENIDLENINFKKIMKFIYIGSGLGYHIQEIDKKIKSENTMIIEPELEIFRLSLFTTDYSVFEEGNRKLFLSVGDDKLERDNKIDEFDKHKIYLNYNIKYYKLLKNHDYIVDEIIDFFHNNYVMSFPYHLIIRNMKKTVEFIQNKDKFLHVDKLTQENIFENKKLLLISAGPSLDNYIDVIEKYQNKFIIVCVDVILRKLEKHNIVPDIVFSIDPSSRCADYLKTNDPKYLQKSVIVLLSQQHEDVMNLLRERNLHYYFSQFSSMIEEIGFLGSVPNVGTYTFQMMVFFGAKELFLIGNDAAFNQETGSRYAKDSSYKQKEVLEIDESEEKIVSRKDILEVKGNLRDTVKTNRSLLEFKYHFDTSITQLKSHFTYNAYNLSDGVLIDGLEPMKYDEFINIAKLNEEKVFDRNDFDKISVVLPIKNYEDDIKTLNAIILKLKKYQKTKVSSVDELMANKIDLMIWILEKTKTLSMKIYASIFLQFTSIIDAYFNFTLNLKQKDLYTKKNLNLLNSYWSKGVISVFKDLKDAVNKAESE